jgi:hypothetical protein
MLVAAATVALVHRPSSANGGGGGGSELQYRTPTAAQLASAWAAIQLPEGFYRSHRCWHPEKGPEVCLVHDPSVLMTPELFARWRKELAPTSAPVPANYPESKDHCSPLRGRRILKIETCGIGVIMVKGQLFTFNATGLVVLRHGKPHGTMATARDGAYRLRGTQLLFLDVGYPAPRH